MSKLKRISGDKCIKILCNRFGFKVARQKGSHMMLIKEIAAGRLGVVVPKHKELKTGTLKGILEQAEVEEDDFAKQV